MIALKENWTNYLKSCILLNLASTVISFSFTLANGGWDRFNLQELIVCFVFSNVLGPPIWYLILEFSNRWKHFSTITGLIKLSIFLFSFTFIGEIIARFVIRLIFDIPRYNDVFPNWHQLLFSLTMAFTFGFGLLFYEILQKKLRQKEVDEEKAKTLATEAQLASLESRIHPHFLFNTLNSIAALIREEPILAEKMVEKLSALLRYSLDSDAKGLVSLKQELEITEKYLEIEKVRFAERLSYKIECEPQFLATKIPPLSLQTLVENSIKHVVAKTSAKTEVIVSIKKNGESLEIKVNDNGKGFSVNQIMENHGLDSLQKRLQTLFSNQASLEIVESGTVNLKIPNSRI